MADGNLLDNILKKFNTNNITNFKLVKSKIPYLYTCHDTIFLKSQYFNICCFQNFKKLNKRNGHDTSNELRILVNCYLK